MLRFSPNDLAEGSMAEGYKLLRSQTGNSSRRAGIHVGQGLEMDCKPVLGVRRSLEFAYHGVTLAKNTLVCMWLCGHGGGPSIITQLAAEVGMP